MTSSGRVCWIPARDEMMSGAPLPNARNVTPWVSCVKDELHRWSQSLFYFDTCPIYNLSQRKTKEKVKEDIKAPTLKRPRFGDRHKQTAWYIDSEILPVNSFELSRHWARGVKVKSNKYRDVSPSMHFVERKETKGKMRVNELKLQLNQIKVRSRLWLFRSTWNVGTPNVKLRAYAALVRCILECSIRLSYTKFSNYKLKKFRNSAAGVITKTNAEPATCLHNKLAH